ncbi:MAG TPA: selenoneine synthase SenA [Burkholderiales bacterium]|nr:selenoneine synthase SenA [Burkholderiales bacterium]
MIPAPTEAVTITQMLLDARRRTLGLIADLTHSQLLGPRLAIVNPPLWEIGHLGWFQERWCLRRRGGDALAPSMREDADALYDSSAVAHRLRWDLPLPALDATLEYLAAVLERVRERLSQPDPELAYFAELCALHEEMHAEAFTYSRQTLAMRAPPHAAAETAARAEACAGDAEIPGGELLLGAPRDGRFVFDNEKWAHPVRVKPFRIARAAVDNRGFAQFVEDDGYARRELWSTEGWVWREGVSAGHPVYWQKADGLWCERRYDEVHPLALAEPVMHVNWHEADAYCRWSGRRLPSEAEWEFAAATAPGAELSKRRYPWGDESPDPGKANLFGSGNGPVPVGALPAGDSAWGCRQMIGNVWEWTADAFAPYPGFVADPYAEYSEPWFGDHKVLRGGSHATRAHLIRNTWRNFYTPDRSDVFAGFRTCAP